LPASTDIFIFRNSDIIYCANENHVLLLRSPYSGIPIRSTQQVILHYHIQLPSKGLQSFTHLLLIDRLPFPPKHQVIIISTKTRLIV